MSNDTLLYLAVVRDRVTICIQSMKEHDYMSTIGTEYSEYFSNMVLSRKKLFTVNKFVAGCGEINI